MTLLIIVKRKDGRVAVTDFTKVKETGLWPETQVVTSREALDLVREFLGGLR